MKDFFKYALATVVGIIIYMIISSLLFFGIIGAIAAASGDKEVNVKENSILHVKLDKVIVDRASEDPFVNIDFMTMTPSSNMGLNDILSSLKRAKTDDNIKGIYLDLMFIPTGIATVEEIRNGLLDFKESGKFIYAYSNFLTQSAYYLASVADSIYMNPAGELSLKGLRAEVQFFKGAMEKVGVEPVIFRHGKFKSAIEPFMLNKMSEANKEQTLTYINSIWKHIEKGIAEQRGMSLEEVDNIVQELKIRNAQTAVDNNIVDALFYKDQMYDKLAKATGKDDIEDINFITLGKYKNAKTKSKSRDKRAKIAVIYAQGEVVMGKAKYGKLASEPISKALRKARLDSSVKAIVFRVNSPGGSALASDIIWREAVLAKEQKPLIVSMGDLAASGGYYISCPADVILANPTTLTGSIGVFGLMFNNQKLMNDKLGITFDGVKTNQYADLGNPHRKMSAAEKQIIQSGVEEVYTTFITHVGQGRGMTTEAVDNIGQGRVWSGINAKEIGLVDEFGGLQKAIQIAAEKAKLDDYKLLELPKQKDKFEALLTEFTENMKMKLLYKELGEDIKLYQQLKRVKETKGVQARMPYDVELY